MVVVMELKYNFGDNIDLIYFWIELKYCMVEINVEKLQQNLFNRYVILLVKRFVIYMEFKVELNLILSNDGQNQMYLQNVKLKQFVFVEYFQMLMFQGCNGFCYQCGNQVFECDIDLI